MATKTPNERAGTSQPPVQAAESDPQTAIARTSRDMVFRPISSENTVIPDSLAHFLAEGFLTQRHVKLTPGDMVEGVFRGMEDGELAERVKDPRTGEIFKPKIKWIYVEQKSGVVIRLLGAYNLIAQLEQAEPGDYIMVCRGANYDLPNGMRCTDYIVLRKPLAKPQERPSGAAGATVEVPTAKAS